MLLRLFRSFDLRHDQREPDAIHEAVVGGVRAAGANLWVLIFAIFVASIGLNVNSTAVIIGAMLISPLMGPIVAIGYGAGVNDFALIKRAFQTLMRFVAMSLITATLYFAISPLSQAQSELLARTSPTLWDVAIAFFGGAAGIVAISRREFSNIVPGVAIATALMPPLCTAGYGLASLNLPYFAGAFYLFSINAVFIAFATLLIVKVLRLPPRADIDPAVRQRTRLIIGTAITVTLVPSAYLAWRLVQREFFAAAAAKTVRELAQDTRYIVLGSDVDPAKRTVVLTLAGATPPDDLGAALSAQLGSPTAGPANVTIRYAGGSGVDLASITKQLQQDLYRSTTEQVQTQQRLIQQLQLENANLRESTAARDALLQELRAEFPEATEVAVAQGQVRNGSDSTSVPVLVVHLRVSTPLARTDEPRLRARLATRFAPQKIDVIISRAE
jgi:uncharacterized hydrophobic protein (TIGR00271 family)